MTENEQFLLKPHHFLDILKLHGAGTEFFVPEIEYLTFVKKIIGPRAEYNHDFHLAGNIILQEPLVIVTLTVGADDVCQPCKFLIDGHCTDKLDKKFIYPSKEEWNRLIDERILQAWNLSEGNNATAIALCQLSKEKITPEQILEIWREKSKTESLLRAKLLEKGIGKYLQKYGYLL